MSLRNLSNFSSSLPSQPTASPMSLGGGKGMAGSQRPQANPQSQMLQQLMQMMMARRTGGMQNPGFMSPLQRMGGAMPQLPSQASPTAVQAVQGNIPNTQPQQTISPGMQAQQAAQVAAAQQQAQQQAQQAAAPAGPSLPSGVTGTEGNYTYQGAKAFLGPSVRGGPADTWYYQPLNDQGFLGGPQRIPT